MKTPKGHYSIFDITEFLPGRPIPQNFCDEANQHGPFFFMPASWTLENFWGGDSIAYIKGKEKSWPMMYSIGFPTAEAALEAATEWENGEAERAARGMKVERDMEELFNGS
jgi:hypothetical protein